MTPRWLFAGTYTSRESEGIYAVPFDETQGTLGAPILAGKAVEPSFVAVHPGGRFVYCVNELWEFEGRPGGGVTAFALDRASARLDLLNAEASHGADPCHLAFHESGRFLFVSNFGGGSIAVLPIREDGALEQASDVLEHSGHGAHPRRQAGPHVHATLPVPGTNFVLAADLGLDQVVVYTFDAANGTLREHSRASASPGAGPRHLALVPGSQSLLVVNELDSTVTAYAWDAGAGQLTSRGSASTLSAALGEPNSAAALRIHPTGRFAFASNRGHDSIARLALTPAGPAFADVTPSGGAKPRDIVISLDGRWLIAANQDSDSLVGFAVDVTTGALSATGTSVRIPSPTSLAFA